jgi:Na+/H+ antiporter
MQAAFVQYIYLILIILALIMLANKLRIAYPIVLVLGGLLLSEVSKFAGIAIKPDLVFLLFLPPLLYEAAWQTSWKELWRWRRIVTSFAFPIVIITSCLIAFISTAIIPGFTLALGFLLGAIISPPDAISATTIMRQVKAPRAMTSIIEGESLLNDASSLIVFRFALAAIITGQFHFQEAAGSFFLVIIMGTLIGLAIGGIVYCIHRFLPTTPSIDIVLTLVTPYCMYYVAEHFHFSGVLAVVSGGLFLSHFRQRILSYRSRIESVNVWGSLVFVLNGLVFMLIGLQLPVIIEQLGDVSLASAIGYGLAISGALMVARLLCTYGAAAFTRVASHFITVADAAPSWKAPLILAWAGMRGVVSLAAALSIPLVVSDGTAFPHRSLILFITFVVILTTLVLQGLTLPWLIRTIKIDDRYTAIPEPRQELIIQKKLALYSKQYVEDHHAHSLSHNEHLMNLRSRLSLDLKLLEQEMEESEKKQESELRKFQHIYLSMLDHQRTILDKMNTKEEFDEEIIRKYLAMIDMEEYKLREKLSEV